MVEPFIKVLKIQYKILIRSKVSNINALERIFNFIQIEGINTQLYNNIFISSSQY